ncbi:MAG: FtsX-like permease family protein [Gemmatimonadales bacterium]
MTPPGFVLRMAVRELRAAPRRLLPLVGSVAIGVAALVAVASFADNVRDSVRAQAQSLLGADLALTSRRPFTPVARGVLDSIAASGARVARVTRFSAMAYVPRTTGSRLVQIEAVEPGYPFYGKIVTVPAAAWSGLQEGRFVVADPSLLAALGARVGDTLSLGDTRFTITGSIESAPGNTGLRTALGPKVYIPARFLGETRLLGFGSRAEYAAFVQLAPGRPAQAVADRYRAPMRAERVRVRTVAEDRNDLEDTLSRLTRYLGLVGLVALLLGGIGVSSAMVVFMRQRRETIAVLRCLGAGAWPLLAVYALEAAVMALAGSVIGAAGGMAAQRALPRLLAGLLPIDVQPRISWSAAAAGVGVGVWIALLFAAMPLLSVRRVPPLAALRQPYESEGRRRLDAWGAAAALALVASCVVLAAWQAGSWRHGAVFSAGIAVALLVLWGAAWALAAAARRWAPTRLPYVWRQGVANLQRPSNQTATIVLAIGFGAFLLGTLLLVQANLLRTLRLTGGPARPNLVLFDVQPDQRLAIDRLLGDGGLPSVGPVPIVPMRLQSVKGRPVAAILADTSNDAGADDSGEPRNGWAFRREYRSTYRDTIVASERVVKGSWWHGKEAAGEVSLESEVAGELGVTVGDTIVWDVQGVEIPTRVASLRDVEWARFEPNFFVVFAPGIIETAPQSFAILTRIERAEDRGVFQRRLAERFPNVSTLDLSSVQQTLEGLISRVVLAIRFMAFFTLATGALVLAGALATSRFQRVREGALLRTLGATRAQLVRVVLAEYLSLGVMASVAAVALALAAAWALARFLFEGEFTPAPLPLAGLVLAVVGLTVGVGLLNSRDVFRRPPLEVLRSE